MTIKDF